MSQNNPKYKRLEALLSETRPVEPDPAPGEVKGEVDALKSKVASLNTELEEYRTKQKSKTISSESIQTNNEAQFVEPAAFTGEKPAQGLEASVAGLGVTSAGQSGTDKRNFSPEQARTRQFIIFVSLIGFVATSILTYSSFLDRDLTQIVINGIGVASLAITLVSALLGFIGFGRVAIPSIALLSIGSLHAAGDPSVLAFAIVIVTAGLLLGRKGLIIYGVLTVISILGINYAGSLGILPVIPVTLSEMIKTLVAITAITLVSFLGTQQLELSLWETRRNELAQIQINRELEKIQANLTDRTHDLQLASEVGRIITQKVSDLDDMLTTAAELIRARFDLYYTQVYLTDISGNRLILRAGTGRLGAELVNSGHRLIIDPNSLNGRAVLEKKPILVEDTLHNPNFKPNPLLPETRSEMAVPLIAGGKVIGVLDMQSNRSGTLNESNLPAFEALAGQMTIAIQNAQLFAETAQARANLESQAKFLTRSGWMDYMNAIHKPERTGYIFDQTEVLPLVEAGDAIPVDENLFSVPLEITGEKLGDFRVQLESDKLTEERKEWIQNVAQQVAQRIENLRLLETAERYRAAAEETTRRLTHEGWKDYSDSLGSGARGFAYDLEKVVPLGDNSHYDSGQNVSLPLSVRKEKIGEMTVLSAPDSNEASEILATVAEQLSSHIETLRLSEQNEKRTVELEKAVAQLRELDRLKSSFLANMSHELRTPLNSILGFADVMLEELDGPLTDNMQTDLGLIQKNGQHLLHLINDVLDMAKIEAGRMNLNPEKFKVHEILEEVTSITSTLASEKNLALFIEQGSDRQVEITADRTRLRQVLINLVNNSIKFTEKGKISIHAAASNEHVLIRVKDTGIGIPTDKLEDVFMEFAQVDNSTTRKAGGTGLGLPISRRLIELHGGRLWAESSGLQNEGSTFNIELPLEARLTEPVEKMER